MRIRNKSFRIHNTVNELLCEAHPVGKMVFLLQPALSLGRVLVDDQGKQIPMNFDHGTTTLGFKFQVTQPCASYYTVVFFMLVIIVIVILNSQQSNTKMTNYWGRPATANMIIFIKDYKLYCKTFSERFPLLSLKLVSQHTVFIAVLLRICM